MPLAIPLNFFLAPVPIAHDVDDFDDFEGDEEYEDEHDRDEDLDEEDEEDGVVECRKGYDYGYEEDDDDEE